MAQYTANIIPLTSMTCKVHFINYDGIRTDGLTEVVYEGNTFTVIQTGVLSEDDSNNGWCIVAASFADFDNKSRVILEVAGGGTPELGYGLIYNSYIIDDVRGVAPTGFRIPSLTDINTLQTAISSSWTILRGDRLLADGDPYWSNPAHAGSNTSGFTAYGAGARLFDGTYSSFRNYFAIWTTTFFSGPPQGYQSFFLGSFNGSSPSRDNTGLSIRCLSDTEPPTATVQDQDGNNYTWVQIGSQYWLAQNLRTQTFNNGDPIPTGFDNAAWSSLTSAGWAYPNGDPSLPI